MTIQRNSNHILDLNRILKRKPHTFSTGDEIQVPPNTQKTYNVDTSNNFSVNTLDSNGLIKSTKTGGQNDALKNLADKNQPVPTSDGYFGQDGAYNKGKNVAGAISAVAGGLTGMYAGYKGNSTIADTSGVKKQANSIASNSSNAETNDALLNDINSFNPMNSVSYGQVRGASNGDMAKNTLNSVVSGASAGSVAGPWGAAIGAVVGLGTGVAGIFSGNSKAKREKRRLNGQIAAANQSAINNFANTASNINTNTNINLGRNYFAQGGHLFEDGGKNDKYIDSNERYLMDYAQSKAYRNRYNDNGNNENQNVFAEGGHIFKDGGKYNTWWNPNDFNFALHIKPTKISSKTARIIYDYVNNNYKHLSELVRNKNMSSVGVGKYVISKLGLSNNALLNAINYVALYVFQNPYDESQVPSKKVTMAPVEKTGLGGAIANELSPNALYTVSATIPGSNVRFIQYVVKPKPKPLVIKSEPELVEPHQLTEPNKKVLDRTTQQWVDVPASWNYGDPYPQGMIHPVGLATSPQPNSTVKWKPTPNKVDDNSGIRFDTVNQEYFDKNNKIVGRDINNNTETLVSKPTTPKYQFKSYQDVLNNKPDELANKFAEGGHIFKNGGKGNPLIVEDTRPYPATADFTKDNVMPHEHGHVIDFNNYLSTAEYNDDGSTQPDPKYMFDVNVPSVNVFAEGGDLDYDAIKQSYNDSNTGYSKFNHSSGWIKDYMRDHMKTGLVADGSVDAATMKGIKKANMNMNMFYTANGTDGEEMSNNVDYGWVKKNNPSQLYQYENQNLPTNGDKVQQSNLGSSTSSKAAKKAAPINVSKSKFYANIQQETKANPQLNETMSIAYNYLIKKGFKPVNASAIVGCIYAESRMNPQQDNGDHCGLLQWTKFKTENNKKKFGDRYNKLIEHTKQLEGDKYKDGDENLLLNQLAFIADDLRSKDFNNGKVKLIHTLSKSQSIYDSAKAIMEIYGGDDKDKYSPTERAAYALYCLKNISTMKQDNNKDKK